MSNVPIEDDSWSDLAAELGLESGPHPKPQPSPGAREQTPPPAPAVPPAEEAYHSLEADDESADEEGPDAVDAEPDDTVVIPALQGEPEAEGDAGEPGGDQPGQGGRKRRRRRRRRKKGGGAQPADANGPATEAAAGEAEDEAADDGDEPGDEAEGFEEEAGGLVAVGGDEPSNEAARDVIANWNVPSWQEIVAGLYRPDR